MSSFELNAESNNITDESENDASELEDGEYCCDDGCQNCCSGCEGLEEERDDNEEERDVNEEERDDYEDEYSDNESEFNEKDLNSLNYIPDSEDANDNEYELFDDNEDKSKMVASRAVCRSNSRKTDNDITKGDIKDVDKVDNDKNAVESTKSIIGNIEEDDSAVEEDIENYLQRHEVAGIDEIMVRIGIEINREISKQAKKFETEKFELESAHKELCEIQIKQIESLKEKVSNQNDEILKSTKSIENLSKNNVQKTTYDANVLYWIKKHKELQLSLDRAKEFNRREEEALKITIHKLQEDLTECRKSLTSLQNQKSAGLGQGLSLEECKKKSNESFQTKFALIKTFHDDEKAGLIDSHHKLVSEKEDQIKALRYGISNMKTKYDANFKELSDLKDSFEKSKVNRDTNEDLSKKLYNQIELLIKEAKDKDECYEKENNALKDQLHDKTKEFEEIRSQLDASNKLVEKFIRELGELESKNSEMVKKLKDILDSNNQELKAVKDELQDKTKAYDDINIQLNSSNKQIEQLKSQIEINDEKFANEIEVMKSNNAELSMELKNLLESKSGELEKVTQQLEDKSKLLENISQKFYKINKLSEGLKSQIEILSKKEEENGKVRKEYQDSKMKTAERIKKLEDLLVSKTEELNSVRVQLDHVKKANNVDQDLSRKAKSSNQLITELKSQIEILNKEVEVKDDKLKNFDSLKNNIRNVKEALSNEKIQNAKFIQMEKEYNQNILDLQSDLQESTAIVDSLKLKLNSLNSISKLEKESCENEINSPSEDEKIRQLSTELKEANQRIAFFETKIKEEEATVTDLKIKISIKDKKIRHLMKKEEQFWSPRVQNLSNQIVMKAELNRNENTTMPSAKDPANQNDYLQVRENLVVSDELNNAYQTLLQDKDSEILNLQKRTETLEAEFKKMQSDIMRTSSTASSNNLDSQVISNI